MVRKQVVRLSHWLMPAVAVLSMLAVAVLPGLANPGSVAAGGPPLVQWVRGFGGEAQDAGESVRQTPDGGYVVAGSTSSFGSGESDAYLVKTDSSGNSVWQRTYGGSGSDWLVSVDITQDGGFILAGVTTSIDPGDIYLVKTDSDGVLEWEQAYGGYSCVGARACSDGGYIVAGVLDEDLYLVKTYANGSVEWSKTLETDGYVYPESIEQAEDGGFVVVGYSSSQAVYLAKTNSNGDPEWQQLYAFGSNPMNCGTCVKQTDDEGYIIAGYTGDFGWLDVCLIKTDLNGLPLWGGTYGDVDHNEHGESVVVTADGGYAVAGVASRDTWQAYLVKTDSSGYPSWDTVVEGSGLQTHCWSVEETLDGGYVLAGVDEIGPGDDDLWLAKLGSPSPNQAPVQPGNVSPSDGAAGVSLTPTIQSTAFSDPDSGDTHAASQWQITATAGDYSSPVFDSGADTVHLTSIDAPSLGYSTTYYWHVRHQDNRGMWSSYSPETSFTTMPIPPVVTVDPAAQSVAAGGTFSIDIAVDPSGYGLSGGEMNLVFDPAAMSVTGIVGGDLFGENPVVGTEQVDNTMGTITYAMARVGATTSPTSPGVFATITFTAKGAPGTHAIDITSIGLADGSFNGIAGIVTSDGNVTVGYPAWDINRDGAVNYVDLAMLGAAYGTGQGDPGFSAVADINQDGLVNYVDLAILGAHYGEEY